LEFFDILQQIKPISNEIYEKTLEFLNPKLYFLKLSKLFLCEGGLFFEIDQQRLENTLKQLILLLDLKDLAFFLNKNPHILEEIINSYLEQSFGNSLFTKFLYFFVNPLFDLKIRK